MRFGLGTRVGRMNRVLDGVQIPTERAILKTKGRPIVKYILYIPYICCGNAAFCQVTMTTCNYYLDAYMHMYCIMQTDLYNGHKTVVSLAAAHVAVSHLVTIITRSTGTVHTSTKARLTSIVIWIQIRDMDFHQNLIICSLAHCQPSLKISCRSIHSHKQLPVLLS